MNSKWDGAEPPTQGRPLRGDSGDGQGAGQPAAGSSCSRYWPRPRAPSTSWPGPAGQSGANTSQHLQALHAAGLVSREREGNRVRYELAGDEALSLWLALRDASAAQLGEVERAARDYLGEEVESIGRDELRARMRRGDVVLVDVRSAEEFDAGHIEGARSIPLDELEQRLAELPADQEIVAYCRGPFCAYAHEAVRRLRAAAVTRAGSRTAGPSGGSPSRNRNGARSRERSGTSWMDPNLGVQGYA